jgi:hypothetical protein
LLKDRDKAYFYAKLDRNGQIKIKEEALFQKGW